MRVKILFCASKTLTRIRHTRFVTEFVLTCVQKVGSAHSILEHCNPHVLLFVYFGHSPNVDYQNVETVLIFVSCNAFSTPSGNRRSVSPSGCSVRSLAVLDPDARNPRFVENCHICTFSVMFCGFGCCHRSGSYFAHRLQNLVHFDEDQLDWPELETSIWAITLLEVKQGSMARKGHKQLCENAFVCQAEFGLTRLATSNFSKTLFQRSLLEICHKQFCQNAFSRIAARRLATSNFVKTLFQNSLPEICWKHFWSLHKNFLCSILIISNSEMRGRKNQLLRFQYAHVCAHVLPARVRELGWVSRRALCAPPLRIF